MRRKENSSDWKPGVLIRPNYKKWLRKNLWRLSEAAALFHGVEPDGEYVLFDDDETVFNVVMGDIECDDVDTTLKALESNMEGLAWRSDAASGVPSGRKRKTHSGWVCPAAALAWAVDVSQAVPAALREKAAQAGLLPEDEGRSRWPTTDGVNVFRRLADGSWTVVYDDKAAVCKHQKGLLYIAHLLERPNKSIGARDLRETRDRVVGGHLQPEERHALSEHLRDSAHEEIDQRALKEYRGEINRLKSRRLEAATKDEADGLAAKIKEIEGFLGKHTRMGGGSRDFTNDSKREVDAVSKAIRDAIKGSIRPVHLSLADHLEDDIATGSVLSYRASVAQSWDVTSEFCRADSTGSKKGSS